MLRIRSSYKTLTRLGLAALVAGLAACASPERPGPTLMTATQSDASLIQQADEAQAQGNYVIAAQIYLRLAEQGSGRTRAGYQLQAAQLLQQGQLANQVDKLIAQIDTRQLTTDQSITLRRIQARQALNRGDASLALQQLDLPLARIPQEQRADWHALRAEAYTLAGNALEAIHEYIMLEPLLEDAEAINQNHEHIWASLQPIDAATLMNLRSQPAPDILSGWLELAYLYKSNITHPERLPQQLQDWLARYTDAHPASGEFLAQLPLRQYQSLKLPDNIALLLPLSGAFAAPAEAVRDGFLAAYYARSDQRYNPDIRIYDTTDQLATGLEVYHTAIADGADLIIGPLHKPLLEALAEAGEFPVTTLALNYLGDTTLISAQLYQYGLLPEDEARQVAERAWLAGYNHALVLTPQGEWGERMLNTFNEHWQQLDGITLETQRYDARKHDFAQPVVELLNIDESRTRYQQLKRLTGLPLKFEPRRRQDIDFIYVAAFPGQARQIRPQLKFYYAGDIPVFSTSHLYSGEARPSLDRDMDGIQFCDMPWVFNSYPDPQLNWPGFEALWGNNARPFKRLYAMGVDAFKLVGQLERLASQPQQALNGATGRLYLDDSQRIHRQLQWARFVAGVPRLIDEPQ